MIRLKACTARAPWLQRPACTPPLPRRLPGDRCITCSTSGHVCELFHGLSADSMTCCNCWVIRRQSQPGRRLLVDPQNLQRVRSVCSCNACPCTFRCCCCSGVHAMRFAELTPLVILMPYVKLKALANAKRHLPNAIAKRIWQHLSTSVSTHCGKWVWF